MAREKNIKVVRAPDVDSKNGSSDKLSAKIRAKMGEQLRMFYLGVVNQGMPDRFSEILRNLDELHTQDGQPSVPSAADPASSAAQAPFKGEPLETSTPASTLPVADVPAGGDGEDLRSGTYDDPVMKIAPGIFTAGAALTFVGAVGWISGLLRVSYFLELSGTAALAVGTVLCALTLLWCEERVEDNGFLPESTP
jgi:hypothetical protein